MYFLLGFYIVPILENCAVGYFSDPILETFENPKLCLNIYKWAFSGIFEKIPIYLQQFPNNGINKSKPFPM